MSEKNIINYKVSRQLKHALERLNNRILKKDYKVIESQDILFSMMSREIKHYALKEETMILKREKFILIDYVEGLKYLSEIYNDETLLLFTKELKESDMYIQAFEKTVALAEKRNVPQDRILKSKKDIDNYFKGGN